MTLLRYEGTLVNEPSPVLIVQQPGVVTFTGTFTMRIWITNIISLPHWQFRSTLRQGGVAGATAWSFNMQRLTSVHSDSQTFSVPAGPPAFSLSTWDALTMEFGSWSAGNTSVDYAVEFEGDFPPPPPLDQGRPQVIWLV